MEKYIIGKSITTLLRRPPPGVLKPFVLSSFFSSKHGAESPFYERGGTRLYAHSKKLEESIS
jgi:hypothetical protein